MKCDEFKECVCEIVDKRLSDERTNEMLEHARVCHQCNFEYRSTQAAKQIVHSKLQRQSLPPEIYYSIVNAAAASSGRPFFKRLFGFNLNPAVALVIIAAAAVGLYSLFFTSKNGIREDANIISQSLKNYQAVIGGSIKPQFVSSEEDVRSYLTKEVSFDVNVPKMKGCSSCSGTFSNFNGIKLAHVVYQVRGKNVIYIYQASMNDAMDGKTIGLPDEVRDELKRSDWYIRELPDNTTIVMWRYKNTLCSAVSDMKKDQMIALLTEKEMK